MAALTGRTRTLRGIANAATLTSVLTFGALAIVPHGNVFLAGSLVVVGRIAYAIIDAPHNGISGILARTQGHVRVARWRVLLSSAAALAISGCSASLTLYWEDPRWVALLLGGRTLACLLLVPMPRLISSDLAELQGNAGRPFTWPSPRQLVQLTSFSISQVIGFSAIAALRRAILHLKLADSHTLAYAIRAMGIAQIAALPLFTRLNRRLTPHGLLEACNIGFGLFACLILPALQAGSWAFASLLIVLGLLIGGVSLQVWIAFSQLVEKLHIADAAMHFVFSLFMVASMAGLGLASVLTGWWLARHPPGQSTSSLVWLTVPVLALCALSTLGERLHRRYLPA